MVAKKNEKQTEIDFGSGDPKIMEASQLQAEATRLRTNLSSALRRGYADAIKKTSDRLWVVMSEISSRTVPQKTMPKPRATKDSTHLKNVMREFYSRKPEPTYLEQSVFIATQRKNWIGAPCAFFKVAEKEARVSNSSVYRFVYIGNNLTPDTVAALSGTEMANASILHLNTIAHLPRDMQHLPDSWPAIGRKGNTSKCHMKVNREVGYSYGPQPGQVSFPGKEPSKTETKEQVLAREDYHHIARIIGAQNNELRLKLKEILTENHKSDLQGQVDVASTMNHILKELQEIRKILANHTTGPAIESTAPAESERCTGE